MKSTERFTDRVENYVKYRPHYPSEIIAFLETETGLERSSVIADIGSGTGISSELFLKNGNTVYGVEPNQAMRQAGEDLLRSYKTFHSRSGTAEETSLEDESIDYIIAGQAFHWFDIEKAKFEFSRILKPDGWIVLIWNERLLDTTPFLIAYENLLNNFGNDYTEVQHKNVKGNIASLFKKNGYKFNAFPNKQIFDLDGLQGRLLSSSYIPAEDSANYKPMIVELQRIFDQYQIDNKVEILYTTEIYYGKL